jgi:hypothetical protein
VDDGCVVSDDDAGDGHDDQQRARPVDDGCVVSDLALALAGGIAGSLLTALLAAGAVGALPRARARSTTG